MKSCTCERCVNACKRIPGIPTPLEAWGLLQLGYAKRLVAVNVWLDDWKDSWQLLMPRAHSTRQFAEDDRERSDVADAAGRCTFLGGDERCQLHYTKFKPRECRLGPVECTGVEGTSREEDRLPWRTTVGVIVLARWRALVTGSAS